MSPVFYAFGSALLALEPRRFSAGLGEQLFPAAAGLHESAPLALNTYRFGETSLPIRWRGTSD